MWYLGEDTKAFLPNGQVETSGSWTADVNDAEPGIIMEAAPQIPDSYRQEYLKGQAEDSAWIVGIGGSLKIPYGTVHNTLTTLEHSALETKVVEEKIYAPGLGVVWAKDIAGGNGSGRLEPATTSQIVIEMKFVRVGAQANGVELVDALVLDPRVDDVLGEDPTL